MKQGAYGPIKSVVGKSGHKYILAAPRRKFGGTKWRVLVPVHGVRKKNSRGGVQKNLGYFTTIKDAVAARDAYLKSL